MIYSSENKTSEKSAEFPENHRNGTPLLTDLEKLIPIFRGKNLSFKSKIITIN
jgi:hypothetical protein